MPPDHQPSSDVATLDGVLLSDSPSGSAVTFTRNAVLKAAGKLPNEAMQAQGRQTIADIRRAEAAKQKP